MYSETYRSTREDFSRSGETEVLKNKKKTKKKRSQQIITYVLLRMFQERRKKHSIVPWGARGVGKKRLGLELTVLLINQ